MLATPHWRAITLDTNAQMDGHTYHCVCFCVWRVENLFVCGCVWCMIDVSVAILANVEKLTSAVCLYASREEKLTS